MKLSETLNYINQALNYPALTFNDVSLFFDAAIAELNTTLHTQIPSITTMIATFRQNMSKIPTVILKEDPQTQSGSEIPVSVVPVTGVYYNPNTKLFYYKGESTKTLYGAYLRSGRRELYKAIVIGSQAAWQISDEDNIQECDFSYYLPDDWVLLWLIPYVCFKYTVRDGGTASTFAEELTQGFQQLQDTYNVPERVNLVTVAGKEAYSDLTKEHLDNLNIYVRTRAIYQSMKHDRALNAVFGSMYDRGGF